MSESLKSDPSPRRIPKDDSAIPPQDSDAGKENRAILLDEYEHDGRRRKHRRDEGIKDIAYYATAALVWGGVVLIIATSAVWAFHMLAPPCLRWLTSDEVGHIQGLLFSGALSAALTLLGRRLL